MAKVDILSIGAHAGDAEIASGIALAHEVNAGKKVAMCHLTLGEKGNPKMDPDGLRRPATRGSAGVGGRDRRGALRAAVDATANCRSPTRSSSRLPTSSATASPA